MRSPPPARTAVRPLGKRRPAGELRTSRDDPQFDVGGAIRRLARQTARLWRGVSYDNAIAIATEVRRLLGLERPIKPERTIERLTRPEVDQLLEHAYRRGGQHGLMIKTLIFTGARVSEFVRLDVRDFNYPDKEIRIVLGKGGKSRVVPILPALADEIRTFIGHRARGPLFQPRGINARSFSQRRIEQIVQELAAAAGIVKRVYPHLMRHTIAQHLLEGGMSLDQVQRFLGHRDISTTQIYAASTAAMIRQGYRDALSPKEPR